MHGESDTQRLLGELTADLRAVKDQNARIEAQFAGLRKCVDRMSKKLDATAEKVTLHRSIALVLKWLLSVVIAAAGLLLAYKVGSR